MKSCWRVKGIILLCIASSEADAKKDLAELAEASFVRYLRFYGFTVHSALAFLPKGHELKIFIQYSTKAWFWQCRKVHLQ